LLGGAIQAVHWFEPSRFLEFSLLTSRRIAKNAAVRLAK
jgi:hypothetical protein